MTPTRWTSSLVIVLVTSVAAGTLGYILGSKQAGPEEATTEPLPVSHMSERRAGVPKVADSDRPNVGPERSGEWGLRWQELRAQPRSPRAERDQALLLTELAARDHARALQLALSEPNLSVRAQLRNAVLRGWATADAKAAADFALTLREAERASAMASVFHGAAANPAAAAKLAGEACDRDPTRAFEYSQAVVSALGEQGNFDVAVNFLTSRPPSAQRDEETDNAFALWAEHRPADAAAAIDAISDPDLRAAAFRGLAVGWSHADPSGLADYAARLPPGSSRAVALANAIPHWVEADPTAAVTWLSQREPSPDFDSGVAAVALLPSIIGDRPELAVSLAQSITDAPLRSNTLHNLALTWAKTDPKAAANYVQSSTLISGPDKALLLAEITGTTGE